MSDLDKMLEPTDHDPQHPLVRWMNDRLKAGDEFKVQLIQENTPLGSSVSGIYLLRKEKDGTEHTPQIYEWDDDLNSAMINLGIPATDPMFEGLRFAMVMRKALRKVERKYGDGYMNGILVQLIDESDLGRQGEIKKVRQQINTSLAYAETRSYHDCRNEIAVEIGGLAKELREKLKYPPETLKLVMDKAIAQYLDERFSITTLRKLGWIDENGRTVR